VLRRSASVCRHRVVWRRRSFWFNLELQVVVTTGVATLGVGLAASCLVAFLGSSTVATPIVAAVVCVQVSRTSSRGARVVEYHTKIIPKPKIFTETRTQDSFRVCDFSSCNILAETKFCILRRSFMVLSFRGTETIFTGNLTQDKISVLWPLFL
jgi:hypothetical protein